MAELSAVTRLDAEQAVVGSLLLDESLAPAILAAVDLADISGPANRRILQAARALLREAAPVDPITLRDKLGPESAEYMVQLMEITPTAANWRVYADLLHEQATLARVQDLARELADASTLEECRGQISKLGDLMATGKGVDAWSMADAYRWFMASQASDKKPEYISYGIREIDEGTYTEPGDVVVIGGEPSAGKTALGLMLAYHMAKKYRVGFFSLETGTRKLTARLVSAAIGINFNDIKRGTMDEAAWLQVAQGGEDFTARGLTLIPAAGMTPTQIQAESRARGFQIIFVDYIQLVEPEGDPRANTAQAIAGVSRSMHTFAQSTGTLVVELAQLSRPEKSGGWRPPDMHSLKETGQLEQDADAIMLLYRPKPDGDLDPDKTRLLKIAKQKEGRLGTWPLAFDGAHQRFSVLAGPDGRTLRQLVNRGKAAKSARHAETAGQLSFQEIRDSGDEPF
jgi:replicative DNA helicase|nr:MAG TPA: Helicase, ATPase, REPLICATION [Caudoviricetes sp.]